MNTAVIRITLTLLAGVIVGYFLKLPLKIAFLTLLFGTVLFLIAFFRARKLLFADAVFGSSTFLLFFLLGINITSLHLPQNQPQHFLNQVSSEGFPLLKLRISETLKPDLYNNKYIAEVLAVDQHTSLGKMLLLQPKDTLKKPFLEGQEFLISVTPEIIPAPLNPHQFDYSEFMARKGVHRQLNLRQGIYHKLPEEDIGIKAAAAKLRKQITTALKKKNFGSEELAVVQALLLGQKQDISVETYNNFAAAGAIHILAVSGLHVGVILLILNRLFAPIRRLKNGKYLKTFLVVICLWGFAILAGLSPSVVRAVTMFSFVAVGLEINRRTSTLNSVFLSLMLLLLIRPQWIFEVGFQLSYSAVISIVLFQPLLAKLYEPKTKVAKYLWGLLTVTIAAQVGVLPLSLFYFHQFPGLFFLSNLLILPFLGFILILGVLVIALALLGALPPILARAYEGVIEMLNSIVTFIAKQEQFLFKDIPFNFAEVLGWYFFITMIFLLWKNFSYRKLLFGLASVAILQLVYISEKITPKDCLVVFHKSRSTIVAKAEKERLEVYHRLDTPVSDLNLIKNYRIGQGFTEVAEQPLKNIYLQKGHFLFLLDSTGILPESIPHDGHLLLTGSPKINLERVLKQARPSTVIADGNNYKALVAKWKETATQNGIKFHFTGKDGAFILE